MSDQADRDWRAQCVIGNKSFTESGQKAEVWVRWTGPQDCLYYWLHPIENRWVGEPDQITMPTFANISDATAALYKAPLPPGAVEMKPKPIQPREITTHRVNGCNERLRVWASDEPGSGGAHHVYTVDDGKPNGRGACFTFQNGPIKEVGVNGLTHEVLLAIVIDRLQCFQRGPYSCRENAIALTKLEEAMMWLQKRTRDRISRGVEGTHEK